MTEQEYIDYFEELARRHTAIRHSDTERRFFVVKDNNRAEVDKAVRNELHLPALLLDQYYDDLDRSADNFRLRIEGGLSVLVKCEVSSPADLRRARGEARVIALSIVNRMYRDCRNPAGSLYSQRIIPSTEFQGEPVDPIGGSATGWGYPFTWTMPTTVAVDGDDWLDMTATP